MAEGEAGATSARLASEATLRFELPAAVRGAPVRFRVL